MTKAESTAAIATAIDRLAIINPPLAPGEFRVNISIIHGPRNIGGELGKRVEAARAAAIEKGLRHE